MNAPAVIKAAIPAPQISETELLAVLKSSLYPGAKEESIKLVIGYCKAAGLDPMLKPVHIVPMLVPTGRKNDAGYDDKEYRDVIMPGIGLYRTQAARSGQYAGISEPRFGEDVTETLGETKITYPRWCKVTARRIVQGHVVEFTACEFWRENYATKSSKSSEPNAMWKRRAYGQLSKCAESQALRKAFPELGAQPTAEEMEGRPLDETTIDMETGEVSGKPAVTMPQAKSANKVKDPAPQSDASPAAETPPSAQPITPGALRILQKKLDAAGVSAEAVCAEFAVDALPQLPMDAINEVYAWVGEQAKGE